MVKSQPCVSFSGDSVYGPHFKGIGQRFGDINLAFLDTGQYKRR
jgi:L-ascorbate metabolism protein UlaG (beta-lactamase superfamily)